MMNVARARAPITTEIDEEAAFDILSNRRRRFVLHALESEGQADLGHLAERIAAWEDGTEADQVTSRSRKSVYTSLQQCHLPKMDDADIVDYDRRAGVVEPTEAAEQLDVYLEILQGHEIPWHGYYLGLSAIGASLLLALFVDAPPFTLLPDLAWVAFLVAAMVVSAVAHTVAKRRRRLGASDRPLEVGA